MGWNDLKNPEQLLYEEVLGDKLTISKLIDVKREEYSKLESAMDDLWVEIEELEKDDDLKLYNQFLYPEQSSLDDEQNGKLIHKLARKYKIRDIDLNNIHNFGIADY